MKQVARIVFWVLLTLAALALLWAFRGALLAIPLAALGQLLLERFVLDGGSNATAPPRGRDQDSALRYEAQQLAADIRQIVRHKDDRAGASIDALEDEMEGVAIDLDRLLARRQVEPADAPRPAGQGGAR